MSSVFRDEVDNKAVYDQALSMMSNPTTSHRLFGAGANPESPISLIVPDNDILGSVLARKVRRLERLPSETMALTANFCQAPTARRYSIVAHRRDSIMVVYGFSTVSWTFERDIDCEGPSSGCSENDFTLTIHIEALFVDARERGQGHVRALQDAIVFWANNLVVEFDRKASRQGVRCGITIVLTGDANSSFDLEALRRFAREMDGSFSALGKKRSFGAFDRTDFFADITWADEQIEY